VHPLLKLLKQPSFNNDRLHKNSATWLLLATKPTRISSLTKKASLINEAPNQYTLTND
jgi:hypothetical protein